MITHDLHIRKQLHKVLESRFSHNSDVLILDELGCCQGAARIDIAVITDQLHGFEIKSENDTLERLESQVIAYDSVFDTSTLVTTEGHMSSLDSIVPDLVTSVYRNGSLE